MAQLSFHTEARLSEDGKIDLFETYSYHPNTHLETVLLYLSNLVLLHFNVEKVDWTFLGFQNLAEFWRRLNAIK